MADTTASEAKLKKVTNVWRIEFEKPSEDGEDGGQGYAFLARPQDWGDPRWMYREYVFIAPKLGYEHHVHCWLDHQVEEYKHAELFASLIVQVLLPGTPENRCTNQFMDEEDFWDKSWGKMPTFISEDEEDGNIDHWPEADDSGV